MAALNDEMVQKFHPTTHFRDYSLNADKRVNSMTFSDDGRTLSASTNDHVLDVFDCNGGNQSAKIFLQKYGCGVIDFIGVTAEKILISSRKRDHVIRPLTIETKSYGQYYVGHSGLVTSLCVHRSSDVFLSAGRDKTIRLWDTRLTCCLSVTKFDSTPLCAWDPSGTMFGVAVDSRHIQLFDLRGLDNGPVVTFNSNKDFNSEWCKIAFSHDGKQILISTNGTKIRVIDSFYGTIIHPFLSQKNTLGIPLEAAFSPKGEYVFCGSSDGHVQVWNNRTALKVADLNSNYPEAISTTMFNPKYLLLATGGSNVSFWSLSN